MELKDGFKVVPVEPTTEQFGGMARDVIQWMRFTESKNQHSESLVKWLKDMGNEIPEVFPTPVGVFLIIDKIKSGELRLPHARGGVSKARCACRSRTLHRVVRHPAPQPLRCPSLCGAQSAGSAGLCAACSRGAARRLWGCWGGSCRSP